MHIKKLVFLFVAIVGLNSCANSVQNSGAVESALLQGDIQIDGSSTVYPLTEAVAEEFLAVEPGVKVTIGLSGSGGGFKKFCRGEIDINDASRPIKAREIELCKKANIDYIPITIAYDGLAVLVNPKNTWATNITVSELKKIWEPEAQNKIMRWNQVRSEWPNEELHLYGAGTASGTFDYFTETIVGESGKSRGDYTASEDDNVLVQGIANDQYALGFFGLAYYQENRDKLKLVAVDNGSGAILPSVETVKNSTYVPLSRPLFIYVNAEAAKKPAGQKFINFYLKNASKLSGDVGYIPLTDNEYQKQREIFDNFLKQ